MYHSVVFYATTKLHYLQFVICLQYNEGEGGNHIMEDLYIIKDRLNTAMKLRDMTATELSQKTGLNKSSVSRYLSGSVIPRSIAIGKMALALHVSPAWVLGYDVPMEDGTTFDHVDMDKLTPSNQDRLMSYYQALLDSQAEGHGNT